MFGIFFDEDRDRPRQGRWARELTTHFEIAQKESGSDDESDRKTDSRRIRTS
jgi:hypothetical protein